MAPQSPTAPAVQPPPPLPVRELTLPAATETTLANGLQLVVVPQRELPLLTIQLVLPGGSSAEPADLPGLADATASLLTRGTTTRSAQEIAAAIEQVGSSLNASADQDQISVSTLVLSEYADLAFDLVGDVVLNPTFPESELEISRQRLLTSLQVALSNPGYVATRAFEAIVYGPHPYGRAVTPDSANAITREAVVQFYQAQRSPRGAILVVVGDISAEEAARQAERVFGGWQEEQPAPTVAFPEAPQRRERAIYLVDRPGSTQAELRIGHLGVVGSSADRHAVQVANEVLGGSSEARLFQNLREGRGYTYSISSSFSFPRDRGIFVVEAAVRNEVVEPAVHAVLEELTRLRDELVPPDEFARVRTYMVGSFALRLETSQALAAAIVSLKLRGLPLSELPAYPRAIERVDAEAVREVARRYVHPDQVAIVVVGDASRIRAQLEKLGPVTLVDADGRPVAS